MSSFVVKNNAESLVVDNPLAQAAVTLNVTNGEGANFPSTFPFLITIWDETTYPDPTDDSGMEIVKCTARTTDALTIVRAQEGTGDVAHALGERVAMLITAGILNDSTYGLATKLDGIESGATADQTGAEIKTAYEGQANAYTDTKNTKLAGIATAATKYPDTGEQAFLDADHTKLNGIDTGAKDDQTGAEIKTAYEGQANAYTDTKNTKLAGIDTGADVTADNPPQAHGASVHTDRTRKFFVAQESASSTGDLTGAEVGVRLDADVDETAIYKFKMPADFVSLTSVKAVYYSGSATDKVAILDYNADFQAAGEGVGTHANSDTGNQISITAFAFAVNTDTLASALFTDLTKDDYIRVKITRDADNALDTYTADLIILGIEVEYTADM